MAFWFTLRRKGKLIKLQRNIHVRKNKSFSLLLRKIIKSWYKGSGTVCEGANCRQKQTKEDPNYYAEQTTVSHAIELHDNIPWEWGSERQINPGRLGRHQKQNLRQCSHKVEARIWSWGCIGLHRGLWEEIPSQKLLIWNCKKIKAWYYNSLFMLSQFELWVWIKLNSKTINTFLF